MGVNDHALFESQRVLEEKQQRQPLEDPRRKEQESTMVPKVIAATRVEITWRTVAKRVRCLKERNNLRNREVEFKELLVCLCVQWSQAFVGSRPSRALLSFEVLEGL